MHKILIILAIMASLCSYARGSRGTKAPPVFMQNGHEVSVTDALLSSVKGEPVYKCVLVEASPSKSGTSISLKAVKR